MKGIGLPLQSILFLGFLSILAGIFSGCSEKNYDGSLPDAKDLGSPRGYQIVRTETHFHSPYSYDACDKHGIVGTGINEPCLADLKTAICSDRIDFLFVTDHPDHMADYDLKDLLLVRGSDQLVLKNGLPYANQVKSCSNQFVPTILTGFESKVLSLGMSQHLDSDVATRKDLYSQETLVVRNRLATETDAVVIVPHTESRTLSQITTLQPDAIEIYNLHANLDPKIRKRDLGLPPFYFLPGILTYMVDPYKDLVPDLCFMGFLEVFSGYFKKWNSLLSSGLKVTGVGGIDSHQNIFPQKATDGERLDSHRRLSRVMTNHFLVSSHDADATKGAIKAGHGWVVFEGLGSPVNMDFYASLGTQNIGVGDSVSLAGATAQLVVKAPHIFQTPADAEDSPTIRLRLKKLTSGEEDQVVASSVGQDIVYAVNSPGIFRVEITIIPKHLKTYLGSLSKQADREFFWVITNPIYISS